MPKFKKKPVIIEAYKTPAIGEKASNEFIDWLNKSDRNIIQGKNYDLIIKTLEGPMIAKPGDWIIKGVHGEYYPCKPDIFEKTYERI